MYFCYYLGMEELYWKMNIQLFEQSANGSA